MAVQITCESCGGTDTVATARDAYCYGCKRQLCQSCVNVFHHWSEGTHETGDPVARVEALEDQRDELLEAAKPALERLRAWHREEECDCSFDGNVHVCGEAVALREIERLSAAIAKATGEEE